MGVDKMADIKPLNLNTKMVLANICQVICGKFNYSRLISLDCIDDTDSQIHSDTLREADRQTGRHSLNDE